MNNNINNNINNHHHDTILLRDLLSNTLPSGLAFKYYHISTPPTKCAALFSPLPGRKPERTYCESHFLQVTIQPETVHQVAIFAIEILIYTTAHLTTLFVSKADSTGFATLLNPGRTSASSPLRAISSTFISWLTRSRHRPDRRLVVSLFARAQGQYLFPGSAEHGKKHVLDDRGLVKWWCRTLDPVLREYVGNTTGNAVTESSLGVSSEGFLIVPGQDKYETNAFFPTTLKNDDPAHKRWINGHPLRQLSQEPYAPPRCMIPHFPDDPKARYLQELDAEVSESSQSTLDSPVKRGNGAWRNVKTLEQFWEMLAFRQECSSGRLVGFIWLVFTPADITNVAGTSSPPSPTCHPSQPHAHQIRHHKKQKKKHPQPLRGPILPRAPKIKPSSNSIATPPFTPTTRHYHSPPQNRGTILLALKSYTRATEALLRLDYSDLAIASASTAKWIREVGVLVGKGVDWGVCVEGKKLVEKNDNGGTRVVNASVGGPGSGGRVNVLNVKRKVRSGEEKYSAGCTDGGGGKNETNLVVGEPACEIHELSGLQVCKKAKTEMRTTPTSGADVQEGGARHDA